MCIAAILALARHGLRFLACINQSANDRMSSHKSVIWAIFDQPSNTWNMLECVVHMKLYILNYLQYNKILVKFDYFSYILG